MDWDRMDGKIGRRVISEEFLQQFRSEMTAVEMERVYTSKYI